MSGGPDRGDEILVISALGAWECSLCGAGEDELLVMEDSGPVCLGCADLAHLAYLPRGDAALTRRARKHSGLSAVVVRFSRSRRRYERQGILAEPEAIERAEAECLADAPLRERRRERERERRARADDRHRQLIAAEIRRLYPGCPEYRAGEIAEHATVRGSGRVGRTAAARELDPRAIELAVRASIRHRDTPYDGLLMAGWDRADARAEVRAQAEQVLAGWR